MSPATNRCPAVRVSNRSRQAARENNVTINIIQHHHKTVFWQNGIRVRPGSTSWTLVANSQGWSEYRNPVRYTIRTNFAKRMNVRTCTHPMTYGGSVCLQAIEVRIFLHVGFACIVIATFRGIELDPSAERFDAMSARIRDSPCPGGLWTGLEDRQTGQGVGDFDEISSSIGAVAGWIAFCLKRGMFSGNSSRLRYPPGSSARTRIRRQVRCHCTCLRKSGAIRSGGSHVPPITEA